MRNPSIQGHKGHMRSSLLPRKATKKQYPTAASLPSGAAWGTRLFVLGLWILLSASTALAQSQKFSADLQGLPYTHSGKVHVIVQFKENPTEEENAQIEGQGGKQDQKLQAIKGGSYSVSAKAIGELGKNPKVAYVSPDRPVAALLDYVAPAVGADIAWNLGWMGTNVGVGVAVINSGMADILDLQDGNTAVSRIVYSESFVGIGTIDNYGHGTHVAAIVGGNGKNSNTSNSYKTIRGIAPKVNLINLKVLDDTGKGTDSGVIAAIQRAIQLKKQYNIRVINLSLGRPVRESYKTDPLCQAVEAAWKAGIVVVVAAGNGGRDNMLGTDGYSTILSPANDPYVITVGAMKTMNTLVRSNHQIASYSSKGPR